MAAVEQLITDHLDIWSSAVQSKSSAGRGNSKKQELYGIKKLRELILGTALAGGFTEDKGQFKEPVTDLIKQAREGYSKITGRKMKDFEQGEPLITEFDLPPTWPWVRVADICDLQTGATPSRQKPEYFGGHIRWLVSGDINQGEINDCEGRITEEGLSASNCKILAADTVLIALNGQGKTRASVAHLNVEATCNQSLVGMIPFDKNLINSRFLLLALRYRYYEIRDITGQKQRRGLNMGLVAQLSIPLPPIDIQISIIAKVDELMALCDQLEQQLEASIAAHQTLVLTLLDALTNANEREGFDAAWTRIAEHFDTIFTTEWSIDQLKQSILQLAVMGKLVLQDANDEHACRLLEEIAEKREKALSDYYPNEAESKTQQRKQKKQKLPGDLPLLPNGWAWATLMQSSLIVVDCHNKTAPYEESGVPLLRTSNIRNGELVHEDIRYVSDKTFERWAARTIPQPGDILITREAPMGEVCILPEDQQYCMGQRIMLIRLVPETIDPLFMLISLQDPNLMERVQDKPVGMTVQHLRVGGIETLLVPVPPITEQSRIVRRVSRLMSLCDELKSRIKNSNSTQLLLAEALLNQTKLSK